MKMTKKIKHLSYLAILSFGVASLSSCDTDPKSLDIDYKNIESHASTIYAEYLENLRDYKKQEHYITMAWFDNSVKQAVSRAHHLTTVPDSVDVICLTQPENIQNWHQQEMLEVHKKGTQVISKVSYSAIEHEYKQIVSDYKAKLEELEEQGIENPADQLPPLVGFADYSTERTLLFLAASTENNLDGISVELMGKATLSMTIDEETEYWKNQKVFTDLVMDWRSKHKNKLFVFEGMPQNLGNKKMLKEAKYIVVNTLGATSKNDLTRSVIMALESEVPTSRILVAASLESLDPSDKQTGFFYGKSGLLDEQATLQTAEWVREAHPNFTKAGMAIKNTINDYYKVQNTYQYTKKAIQIMNPSFN